MASQRLEVGKLVAQPFDAARAGFEALVTTLSTAETLSKTHSELEGLLQTDGAELMRELLQGHLTLRGPGRVPTGQVVGEDDVVRTHQRMRDRVLMTVFGAVLVARVAFGARKHDALMPLDGALNLPVERYSHGLRRLVAEETAKTSFEEVVATVAKTTAATIPKRQVEQLAVRAAQDFDAFYETRAVATPEEVAKTGEILVVTGDGKGVRMHRADLREATRKAAEQRAAERTGPARFSLGLPKPADVERDRKRMAEVAAVYTIQRFVRTPEDVVGELQRVQLVKQKRPRPEHKRVWASIRKSPEDVLQTAFDEALRRDPELRKTWVALVDGNETQFTILDSMASIYNVNLTVIIDIIHVIQYVWKAAFALNERGTPEAEKWVRERVLEILRGNASLVAAGMRRSATLRGLTVVSRTRIRFGMAYPRMLRDMPRGAEGIGVCAMSVRVKRRFCSPAAMAGVRWISGPSSCLMVRPPWCRQKLYTVTPIQVAATCTARSFEKPHVLRTFRLLKWRSVPLYRSTNDVLMLVDHADASSAAFSCSGVPNTRVRRTSTTWPFSRFLHTVA